MNLNGMYAHAIINYYMYTKLWYSKSSCQQWDIYKRSQYHFICRPTVTNYHSLDLWKQCDRLSQNHTHKLRLYNSRCTQYSICRVMETCKTNGVWVFLYGNKNWCKIDQTHLSSTNMDPCQLNITFGLTPEIERLAWYKQLKHTYTD